MLENSIYSVISPEGCASILWKSAERAADAAEAMGVTAGRLYELGLVDRLISEPLGGAHRNPESVAAAMKNNLLETLDRLSGLDGDQLVERRYERLMSYYAGNEALGNS